MVARRVSPKMKVKTRQPSFAELRAAYAVYNKTVGKSPNTIHWYEYRLELFERFLGPRASLSDLTVANARAYIADLQDRTELFSNNPRVRRPGELSSAYIQGFARALRAFSSWLEIDGYTESNVLKSMRPPRIQQKVVEVLSDEEIGKLIAVFDRDDAFAARDLAIVWTLLDCGLRASELCNLRIEDAHLKEGYLKVLGKGNKERLVPIGRRCQETILRWRDGYRRAFDFDDDSPLLFLSAIGGPLTALAIDSLLKRAASQAGIHRRIYCHLLRHTFATNYLVRELGDPLRLQQILGHTSLEMVRRYVAMSNVQRSLLETRSSPMDLISEAARDSRQARRVQPSRRGTERFSPAIGRTTSIRPARR